MATSAEITLCRQLIGDVDAPQQFSDSLITGLIDALGVYGASANLLRQKAAAIKDSFKVDGISIGRQKQIESLLIQADALVVIGKNKILAAPALTGTSNIEIESVNAQPDRFANRTQRGQFAQSNPNVDRGGDLDEC